MLAKGTEQVIISVSFEQPVSNIFSPEDATPGRNVDQVPNDEASEHNRGEGRPDRIDRPWVPESEPIDLLGWVLDPHWV